MVRSIFIIIFLLIASLAFGENPVSWWKAESNQANAYLGHSVGSGDFNGDTYDDVISGAFCYANPEVMEGMVFVWYGSSDGPNNGTPGDPTNADWKAESNLVFGQIGFSVSSGDFNGDTYDDILIGARYTEDGENNEGMIFVWYGSASGLGDNGTPANADWKAESNQIDAYLGEYSVCSGDFNGDTYDDVIAAAGSYDNPEENEGMIFVWYGSASGLGDNGTPANAGWKAESNQASASLSTVSSGDFNGDTYDDVVAGARHYNNGNNYEGMVFVWYGSETGLGPDGDPTNADWKAESNLEEVYLGYSVGSGDFNGDTYDDVIAGEPYYNSREGMVLVWEGSSTGLGPDGDPTNADWKGRSATTNTDFGNSVGSGDFNGDTYDDIIVGAWLYSNPTSQEGMVFVWEGSETGLGPEGTPANADWKAESDNWAAKLGWSVGSGNFNNDLYDDMIAGAYMYDNGEYAEGRVFVWEGGYVTAVELSTFTAIGSNGHITICWKTETEADNALWILVRSTAVDAGYAEIARIPARGTSSTGATYKYSDTDVISFITYYYKLGEMNINGDVTWRGPCSATCKPPINGLPKISLYINPNPALSTVTITYVLPFGTESKALLNTTIEVYDTRGRKIETLVNCPLRPGFRGEIVWNGEDATSGIYFICLKAGSYTTMGKVTLIQEK